MLPQAFPRAVAAAAIGGDQQAARLGIARPSHALPPSPDDVYGEAGCVVVDPDTDPPIVARDVLDPILHGAPELGDLEVMHVYRFGFAFWSQLSASVLEVADQFLLLGIYRDCELSRRQRRLHLRVDLIELCVAIAVLLPSRSCVALQTVVEFRSRSATTLWPLVARPDPTPVSALAGVAL